MTRDFESEDEGKRVETADGDVVGTVGRASGSSARIKPDNIEHGSIITAWNTWESSTLTISIDSPVIRARAWYRQFREIDPSVALYNVEQAITQ